MSLKRPAVPELVKKFAHYTEDNRVLLGSRWPAIDSDHSWRKSTPPFPSYFFKIYFKVIMTSTLTCSKCCPKKTLYTFLFFPMHVTYTSYVIILHVIFLVIFRRNFLHFSFISLQFPGIFFIFYRSKLKPVLRKSTQFRKTRLFYKTSRVGSRRIYFGRSYRGLHIADILVILCSRIC